ncbi:MAG: tetratricopeptide repeat protein [Oscillochloris sp.]|nr:tetratricopeptide repeat protein [Oscillochloris sp.]
MEFSLPDRIPQTIAHMLDQGVHAMSNGNYPFALIHFETARQAATTAENQSALLAVHQLLGVLAFQRGDYVAALRNQQQVLQHSNALGFTLGIASALHNLGLIAAQNGDFEEAGTLIDRAIGHYTAIGKLEAADKARVNRQNITRRWRRLNR